MCGGLGEGEQTEMWSARLQAGLWRRRQQRRVGRAGWGEEVQFWAVAPEPLLSRHQKEGELPPDFSRLKWQGMAAPGAPAARAGVQG